MDEPFSGPVAKKLVVAILKSGVLSFSGHAQAEMKADNMTEVDVRNTLNAGVFVPVEEVNGTYRYRFDTSRFAAVVAFRSETHAVVVTAWRFKKR